MDCAISIYGQWKVRGAGEAGLSQATASWAPEIERQGDRAVRGSLRRVRTLKRGRDDANLLAVKWLKSPRTAPVSPSRSLGGQLWSQCMSSMYAVGAVLDHYYLVILTDVNR